MRGRASKTWSVCSAVPQSGPKQTVKVTVSYANNPNPGQTQFPLAAPAGKDSGARTTPPAGAVNQGPFEPAAWKFGPDAPLELRPKGGRISTAYSWNKISYRYVRKTNTYIRSVRMPGDMKNSQSLSIRAAR